MIFTPYPDEAEKINILHRISNRDYALLRITPTMVEKNNIDCNGIFRDLLFKSGIADYTLFGHGSKNGVNTDALFILNGKVDVVNMNFYRVNGERGDRRFKFGLIKKRTQNDDIYFGDLLLFSTYEDVDGSNRIFIVNLTHNFPTVEEIENVIGKDSITELLREKKDILKRILDGDYYDNVNGPNRDDSRDAGDTLENCLGIDMNNRRDADMEGLIEVKSKVSKATKDTLFTLRPHFEGTKTEKVEPSDRNRVSALTRLYGYDSDEHPGQSCLYITIGSEEAPQNKHGFFLRLDEENGRVNMMHKKDSKEEVACFWKFDELEKTLNEKHKSTLWFKAKKKTEDGITKYKYISMEFTRSPQFATFISMIKAGDITYDWRGHTTKSGRYSGKNHGNAWRTKNEEVRRNLFATVDILDLDNL